MTQKEIARIAREGGFTVDWATAFLAKHFLCTAFRSASDFSWALHQLKDGKRVRRAGWNGKDMWLALWHPGTYDASSVLFDNCPAARNYAWDARSKTADVVGSIVLKAADGSLVFGWLASQTDMLAEDWELVE